MRSTSSLAPHPLLWRLGESISGVGERTSIWGSRTREAASALGVPLRFLQLLLAIEDKRFWLHLGIDPIAIARALFMLATRRGRLQGASAIAEQLIKMRFVGLRRRTMLQRSARAALGVWLTLSNTKTDLLRTYLDTVYFGNGYWGLSAAAEGYFAVPICHLSVGHSFFLAERIALPNSFRLARIGNVLDRRVVRTLLGTNIWLLPGLYGKRFGPNAELELRGILRRSGRL